MHMTSACDPRTQVRDWSLAYSTEQHGCSLRTFYGRAEGRGATLLVVLDSRGRVFGGFIEEGWRGGADGRHYFGNGHPPSLCSQARPHEGKEESPTHTTPLPRLVRR